jgi:glycosyltransferase involved in cell wall biosynthesis
MKPMGGSEILYLNMLKHVGTDWNERVNLILSFCFPEQIQKNKINVMWQHLNSNEEACAGMKDPAFVEQLDYLLFVSHWQYNRFKQEFNIPAYKSIVIKNAVEPIPYVEKSKTGKLKLVYTSTPWRGLDVLLNALLLMDRDDIELDIFSSTRIYGDNFEKITEGMFDWLFEQARTQKNVRFHEYQPNEVVRNCVQQAHIFPYPSTFEETSCLSAIEAASAGCQIITSNLGALPETCNDWATYVPHGPNREILASRFAKELDQVIDNYWNEDNQASLVVQSKHYHKHWSWETRAKEWQTFFNTITRND